MKKKMERMKGFEPSTSTLARLRSTPELHPRRVEGLREGRGFVKLDFGRRVGHGAGMKKRVLLGLLLALVLPLAACNTIEGLGKDASAAGRAVTGAAQSTKSY
jgi:predicted small secreted protein